MFILRKTFDDDTSGIEVHDGEDTYRFQIDGDTAVYVGEDAVPQSVEDEIKNQGYASSVTYDVPGSVREYVDANAGGTATETKVPNSGNGYHKFVDGKGDIVLRSQSPSTGGITYKAGDPSASPPIVSGLSLYPPYDGENTSAPPTVSVSSSAGADGRTSFSLAASTAKLEVSGDVGLFDVINLVLNLKNGSVVEHDPQDVTAISSPSKGMVAYNDGSTGTEGPAFYDGSSWISLVDGSTI